MQPASQTLLDTIEQEHLLEMSPVVFAEWEINSYFTPTASTNDGASDIYQADLFPLDSIVQPFRPESDGLPKFLIDEARVTADNTWPKYRIPSPDSIYKYWKSKNKSDGAGAFVTPLNITVDYGESVQINKIVAGFETSWTGDITAEILTSTNGTDFTSIGTWTSDGDGRINVYLQDNDTWSTVVDRDNSTTVQAVRISVTGMQTPNSSLQVIQLSPRYEIELTGDIINVSVDKSRESIELNSPLGILQSNTCSVDIDNSTGRFDPENNASDLYGLIDENVRLQVSYKTQRSDDVAETITQGTFFVDEWSFSSDGSVSVSATDRSKQLQETLMTNVLYHNKTISHIVRDVLERMGITDFDIRTSGDDDVLRYIWFTNEATVWESLTDFATAIQSVFYFDENGTFIWETRDYVWQSSAIDTALYADSSGSALANIESLTHLFNTSANHVIVKYANIHRNKFGKKFITSAAWQASEDIVLRGVPITSNMTAGQTTIPIPSDEIANWPDSGLVNIEGEYIKYDGKSGNNLVVDERGVFNSEPRPHVIDASGWNFFALNQGTKYTDQFGNWSVKDSQLSLRSGGSPAGSTTRAHLYTGAGDSDYAVYGTEIEFPVSFRADGTPYYPLSWGVGGLMIHSNTLRDGYFFEIRLSKWVQNRNDGTHEVVAYKSEGGALYQWLPNAAGKPLKVIPGKRYQLEVAVTPGGTFIFYVNGQQMLEFSDGTHPNGYFGIFTRGYTRANFEYVYAVNSNNIAKYPDIDIARYQDRITGSFASDYALTEWSGKWRSNSEWFMDDFGPWAHEGREFDVIYDQAPALDSNLFISNDSEVHLLRHNSNPFGSKFIIVNAARRAAVLNGNDDIQYQTQSVDQQLFVYGNILVRDEEQELVERDALSIARRGKKELEISSPWIQSKKLARKIAQFIKNHWGEPADVLEVSTILNPALQVGDLVGIYYPDRNMALTTHKYHVTSISTTVGQDFTQRLTLRRARF